MHLKMENPARCAGANRVKIDVLGRTVDTLNPTETHPESPAVRAIARRFSITIPHARVVCELAQIGGAA